MKMTPFVNNVHITIIVHHHDINLITHASSFLYSFITLNKLNQQNNTLHLSKLSLYALFNFLPFKWENCSFKTIQWYRTIFPIFIP